jgi:coenzyme F420-reducing hydrogenase gamma subunit
MAQPKNKKPKVALFDLTDCEGCQVELVGLRERLVALAGQVEVVRWRLGQERADPGPYDISIVEGTPITPDERAMLRAIREESKVLIGLGSCATLGGIPGIIDQKERAFWYRKIYGSKYKPRGVDALPLNALVEVDFLIHGCPINADELVRVVSELLAGKSPRYRGYSVCFECKQAGNPCRLISKKLCLGPITQGGCGAICISGGSPCWGCFGLREEAEIDNLLKVLEEIAPPDKVEQHLSMFLKRTEAYQKFREGTKKKR